MPPRPEQIQGIEWSEEDEEHVEEHIEAWRVEELIEGGDFFVFSNTAGHPPRRWRIVGRTPDGMFVTAIIEEAANADPRRWRPVTAWQSAPFERAMYERERRRLGDKQGRRDG